MPANTHNARGVMLPPTPWQPEGSPPAELHCRRVPLINCKLTFRCEYYLCSDGCRRVPVIALRADRKHTRLRPTMYPQIIPAPSHKHSPAPLHSAGPWTENLGLKLAFRREFSCKSRINFHDPWGSEGQWEFLPSHRRKWYPRILRHLTWLNT